MAKKAEATPEPEAPVVEETTTGNEGTPSEPTPEVEETLAAGQDFNDFLEDEGDDLDVDIPVKATPKGQEAKEGEEATPPAEAPPEEAPTPPAETTPAAEAAKPAPEAAKPEQPPEATPPPAPAEQPAEALTMEAIREQYQKNRTEMQKHVASEVYNLSEEQVQRLDEGDASVIPEMMARVYMDAVTGAVAHMITYLPQMVGDVLQNRDQTSELEEQFYSANANLDRGKHGDIVNRFGAAYRQVYPNAPAADFIRDVGAQVMVALRIPPGNGAQPTPEPAAPKTPPFQPARAGGGGGAVPAPTNPFEQLADEMDGEELDLD